MDTSTSGSRDEAKGTPPKAIQVGGSLGSILPPGQAEVLLGKEEAAGSQKTILVLGSNDCIVSHVRGALLAFLDQPHDLCPSCERALREIGQILTRIVEGEARADSLNALRTAAEELQARGHCLLAGQAVTPLLTSLRHFPSEYEIHLVNRHCPARVCPRLIPAPCQLACPAGIDVPSYLGLVAQGRYEKALDVIREDNPLVWVCGLICPHPCEKACVRGKLDAPINIRHLKAFVAEWTWNRFGYPTSKPAPPTGHKVAVIGSGPAGLTCAHYLALTGHAVTIFESLPVAGGLLMVGIPEYRLPRHIVQTEIDAIRAMGVELETGVTVGRDVTLDELRERGFEAFFLGMGAHRGYRLGIEGEDDFPQVYDAITFLRRVNLGVCEKPPERVIVIGGGNSAMDAARTCIRLGCEEVHVAYRRTRSEMPANPEEVDEAIEEGVRFHFLAVPVRIGGTEGQVQYLECLQAELGQPDLSGRRRPVPVEGSNFRIEAGAVVAAIGQEPDFSPFDRVPVEISRRSQILTKTDTSQTSVEDIFAGGDAVTGAATVVQAIAGGKQAAMDIDRYLRDSTGSGLPFHVHKRQRVAFVPVSADDKITTPRQEAPLVDPQIRSGNFDAVELSLSEEQALREARRCLRCDVCIRCGACERVCRDEMGVHALDFKPISDTESTLGDYRRPMERCITCGACAQACPTNAIQLIQTEEGEREIRFCGTILNRQKSLRCASCGEPFVPQRYLDYVISRSDAATGNPIERKFCPRCARRKAAEILVKELAGKESDRC